jgi:hypothetical protein
MESKMGKILSLGNIRTYGKSVVLGVLFGHAVGQESLKILLGTVFLVLTWVL